MKSSPPPPPPGQIGYRHTHLRDSQRVKHGDLYYKTTTKSEWTPVSPLFDRRHGREAVAEIVFDGGIELCQVGAPDTSDEGQMWRIRWESVQYDKVHVDEFISILPLVPKHTKQEHWSKVMHTSDRDRQSF